MILRLEDRRDLDRARQLATWLNRPSVERVRLSLPWTGKREQQRAARALTRLFNDCGCHVGGLVFLAVLGGTLVRWTEQTGLSWAVGGKSALVAMAAAIAAKLLGLGWSRWRLHVWLDRLASSEEGVVSNSAYPGVQRRW